jgi:hypothetical protein
MRALRLGFTCVSRLGTSVRGEAHGDIGDVHVDRKHGHADHLLDGSRHLSLDLHTQIVQVDVLLGHNAEIYAHSTIDDLDADASASATAAKKAIDVAVEIMMKTGNTRNRQRR